MAGLLAAAAVTGFSQAEAQEAVVTRDIEYVAGETYPEGRDLLDVHAPAGASGAPVLVYLHGGLLTMGDKSEADALAARLVPEGVVVVSANYRLSPGFMHPAHVEDAAAAVAWVRAHVTRYGGDPANVFVGGWSAGAYLAALMAVDAKYLGAHGIRPTDVRGWIPISPFLYVEETARDRPKTVWGEDPADWLAASVSPYISSGIGPMLLIYGDGDDAWRRAQNDRFAAELRAAGNRDVRVVEVPDRTHTGLVNRLGEPDDRIGELVLRFIRTH